MPETEYKEIQLGPRNFSIPEEWSTKKISEICENRDSERDPVKSSEREGGNIPYYGATGQIDSVADYLFDEKLVLIGEDGADWSDFANTAYIIEGKSWVNNHAHVLQCEEVDDEYLKEAINLMNLNYAIVGTNRGKLNKGTLMNLDILYPPLPEQRRIAEILSTVDEAIQQTDEIIETSKELKKGLMQDLLTKGISHDEFKEVSLGPKEIEIPRGWRMEKLGDMASLKNGINFSKDQKGDEGLPTVDVLNMYGPGTDIDTSELYRVDKDVKDKYLLQKGDILFVRSSLKQGGIGWASKFDGSDEPMTFCGFLIRARLDAEKIDTDFLVYYLRDDLVRDILIAGSGKVANTNISQSDIGRLKVPVPTLDEQREIAERLSLVDEKIRQEEEYREKLEELKKGLMQDLLTGKKRVEA